ncbi:MAG: hypothetical protein K8H74_17200 [Notoacmeibacter sp.]|nr:hypothetical protein [Notoacmeibacter sp.]
MRSVGEQGFPDECYSYLAGDISRDALFALHPKHYEHAKATSLRIWLGNEEHG